MNRTILIRYGEIALKSEPVRKEFEKKLIRNIKSTFKNQSVNATTKRGRIFIKTPKIEESASKIANIPGVVSTSPTWKTKSSIEKIWNIAKKVVKKEFSKKGSFAVRSRRVGNHDYSSQELAEKLGSRILDIMPELTVDLDNPEQELFVEIRKDDAYIFTRIIDGIGGLPVGSQGKVLVLFNGDIESLITTFLILRRGAMACPLFFELKEKPREKAVNLFKKLSKFHPNLELRVIPAFNIQKEVAEKAPEFEDVIKERLFLKIAERVAGEINGKALAIDKNLDYLKSFSLHNTRILEEKINLSVLYPLVGYDKNRMKEIGKLISSKTFEKEKTLTNFTKEKYDIEKIHEAEKNISEECLINSALESLQVYKIEEL
ncbi:hypothetical protein AKJ50_00205 [candidate division MSBL1 archaeon SCGC-AAA382A13]|uniref:Probable tRNA sulfurtransferase n=1 Tax=candidate division MSBL1 archaeon SCGC-AAA382A13 TaxID=1698279 RepID=A0A133VGZ0_9EURY|nr:hypothetical protein AKJ50_00205 [candidate division MSBL1 archaeon SCGC-AAA382A13]